MPNQNKASLLASENNFRLESADDAMNIIFSGLPACVLSCDDIAPDFFDFGSGLAGDILQKFVNYRFKIAIVLPEDHKFGLRVTELAREHISHPFVRFMATDSEALKWLSK